MQTTRTTLTSWASTYSLPEFSGFVFLIHSTYHNLKPFCVFGFGSLNQNVHCMRAEPVPCCPPASSLQSSAVAEMVTVNDCRTSEGMDDWQASEDLQVGWVTVMPWRKLSSHFYTFEPMGQVTTSCIFSGGS
jgi:hypothetical protein